MKIAWIFPQNKLCGISFYSHAYVEALKPLVDIVCIDPDDFRLHKKSIINHITQCSLVHIQYETSFFLNGNCDWYFELCHSIKSPIVITLHEVYGSVPGVFPRDTLQGIFPIKKMRQWLYDMRHPYVTALTKHTAAGYCAKRILVHCEFQKDILVQKGIKPEIIQVFPVPVNAQIASPAKPWTGSGPLRLASTGFVSGSFDYGLLFSTLEQCDLPWKFTWIGGVRREEDRKTLDRLHREIQRRNWTDRFVITGAISKENRDELVACTHVYCAFFLYKSSSESLATAIGARCLIVATPLSITREVTRRFPIMLIAPAQPQETALAIRQLATNIDVQKTLSYALAEYCGTYNRERMARQLTALYERELIP
jgi:glycosyltransferase involved in cell wall biosynthesis